MVEWRSKFLRGLAKIVVAFMLFVSILTLAIPDNAPAADPLQSCVTTKPITDTYTSWVYRSTLTEPFTFYSTVYFSTETDFGTTYLSTTEVETALTTQISTTTSYARTVTKTLTPSSTYTVTSALLSTTTTATGISTEYSGSTTSTVTSFIQRVFSPTTTVDVLTLGRTSVVWVTTPASRTTSYVLVCPVPSGHMIILLLGPTDGASVRCNVALRIRVVDNKGGDIAGAAVRFYIDGSSVATKTTNIYGKASYRTCPSAGTHSWYVTADKPDYVSATSGTRSFTVPSPTALEVALLKPTDGAKVTPPLTLMVKATKAIDRTVVTGAVVSFYVDDVYVGAATTDAYGKAKLKTTLAPGTYSWYAAAEKSGFDQGTSPTWHFIVR